MDMSSIKDILIKQGISMLDDTDKIKDVCSKAADALRKMEKPSDDEDSPANSAKIILSMIKDYFKGDYTNVSKNSLAIMLGVLTYVVSPLDIIPDPLPGIGMTDDLALVVFAAGLLAADIITYRNWLKEKNDPNSTLNAYLDKIVGSDKEAREKEIKRLAEEYDTVSVKSAVRQEESKTVDVEAT